MRGALGFQVKRFGLAVRQIQDDERTGPLPVLVDRQPLAIGGADELRLWPFQEVEGARGRVRVRLRSVVDRLSGGGVANGKRAASPTQEQTAVRGDVGVAVAGVLLGNQRDP